MQKQKDCRNNAIICFLLFKLILLVLFTFLLESLDTETKYPCKKNNTDTATTVKE